MNKVNRTAKIDRQTKETSIKLELSLDGSGNSNIETGIGFLDHMLTLFARHGLFDLNISAKGDLDVDMHHTVEDIGIVLGTAINDALKSKEGIKRYGFFLMVMDEARSVVSLDLGGRAYFVYDNKFLNHEKSGEFDTELVEEFFKALSDNAKMNIHIKVECGSNNHHIIESIFKCFAKALDNAVSYDERIEGVMSTKGSI